MKFNHQRNNSQHRRQVAAALGYDQETDPAPHLLAKGWGITAEEIIRVAEENGVPVQKNEDMANVLASLDLGEQIPEELYAAVAEVLAYIYQMNRSYEQDE